MPEINLHISGGGATRRNSGTNSTINRRNGVPIHPDIEPPPKPWPFAPFLAFLVIISLALLQFLPASHFRDPNDPLRNWIPIDSSLQSNNSSFPGHENASYSLMQSNNSSFPGHENASYSLTLDVEAGKIHVVSWMDCLDLRLFAVLINSTISSSRSPERVHFHFFIPEGQEKKLSYYKLKVLFPDSNLEMIGQKEVKEKLRVSFDGRHLWSSLLGIKPFIISTVYPNLSKFIYVTPDVIMKGRVEELFKIDLETHAIAAVEDCSKRLSSSVNFNVLDAVQRSADKPWVSRSPYKRDACVPDMRVLLINANNLAGGKIVQAVQWWDNVLNGGNDRSEETSPAILLTLYNKYLKLDSGWNVTAEFAPSGHEDDAKILHFDGPKRVCSEADSKPAQETHYGNLWRQYMPPSSDRILGD